MTLLASVHDVAPPHLATVIDLRERLARWGVARATLLVVPDFHGAHPLAGSPDTIRWLRERVAAGDEICLHGDEHRQRRDVAAGGDRLRAAVFTAGEGECLTLDGDQRARMLGDGKRLLEDLLGVAVRGFVAPAWLEPIGFGQHLAAAGFAWHEGSLWVERLGDRPRRWRTPVIGFATRTRLRRWSSLGWARLLAPGLARGARAGGLARLALHPADATSPAVMALAERITRRHFGGLVPRTYADALLPAGGSSPC